MQPEAVGAPARGVADLVVVANRLPVELGDGPDAGRWRRSPGGLVSALDPVLRQRQATWVGWSGRYGDESAEGQPPVPQQSGSSRLDEVPLDHEDVEDYYEGFSNAALWPLYHDAVATPTYHRRQFEAYHRVNARFADRVAQLAGPGATVWVHDYQLQLVPQMLRQRRPDLRIGFFLHIPFPPVELFLQLPWRRQVLAGLLGADLVGFQTRPGAQNFLRLTERLLALQPGGDRVVVPDDTGERVVRVDAFPIGIDTAAYADLARRPDVGTRSKELRHELGDPPKILLGVDRLDYTKGIDVRLRAFAELLEDGALAPDEAVLLQIATPSRENVGEYRRIRDEIELLVGRINGNLGRVGAPPIHYLHQPMPTDELVAMYAAADVMLVTPLRDGMNLVCKEYVASRVDNDGALVLSEFTGAAAQLSEAWLINPYDIVGVKRAIVDAVRATPEERGRRMRALRHTVVEQDVHRWARSFLGSLEDKGR